MSGIARTRATGAEGMLPELLGWSSSLDDDRALLREDLVGSAAHVTMLARAAIVSQADARTLRDALRALYEEACAGTLKLPDGEEDVHMAVEGELGKRVGNVAARLHTARSRNDQVACEIRRQRCCERSESSSINWRNALRSKTAFFCPRTRTGSGRNR